MKQKNISSLWNHLSSPAYLWYLPLGSMCTDHFVLTSLKPPPQVFMLDPSNSSNHCFLTFLLAIEIFHGQCKMEHHLPERISLGENHVQIHQGRTAKKTIMEPDNCHFESRKTYSISYRIPIVYQTINLYPHRMVLFHEGWTARL